MARDGEGGGLTRDLQQAEGSSTAALGGDHVDIRIGPCRR
jgi:hypothetical protein